VRRAAVCVIALAFAPTASASDFTLVLDPPAAATYGNSVALRGRVVPTLINAPVTILRDGVAVGTATTGNDGTFVFRTRADGPHSFAATAGELVAPSVQLAVRPRLVARVVGTRLVGRPMRLQAHVEPAGPLHVEVRRDARLTHSQTYAGWARVGLSTRAPHAYRIRVVAMPPAGWLPAARTLTARAVAPNLAIGSRGASVRSLEQRLRALRYALPRVDAVYGLDTYQAVLTFQKVSGLPWTGRVDARVWRSLARAHVPRARYRGSHLEVSKGRQYLFVVRGGRVELAVHVSTGATGNTPVGRWHVYRKVSGWDWVLWYPMYFLRGFAVHGYPSVPAYPASHGCVRVPMWVAQRIHAGTAWGQPVYVYW
jgi:Putative peptidoglycan binding domain/L,D-transpeptidase catalytic domain